MFTFRGLALGLAMAALAGGAQAAPTLDAAPGCDFFQAELIGVLCGGTGYVAPGGQGGEETIRRSFLGVVLIPRPLIPGLPPPKRGIIPVNVGNATIVQRWTISEAYEGATLAVDPWQGVRFHVSGEALQYNDGYSETSSLGYVPHFGSGSAGAPPANFSGAYPGWFGAGAEATILDRTTGSGHYVLNLSGGAQFTPGGGLYSGRDLQQIGWESGAQWRLGASGPTLDYTSSTYLQRLDNPGEIRATSGARLLLANPDWGVAIGPRLDTTTELWHAPGYNTGWSEVLLGGEALIAPFRRTAYPVLRDMTLDVSAAHSLGQAGLVPDWAGSSSRYVYSASARFNFRY